MESDGNGRRLRERERGLPDGLLLAADAGAEVAAGAARAEADPGDDLGAAGHRVLQLLEPSHAPVHLPPNRRIKTRYDLSPKLNRIEIVSHTFLRVSLTREGLSAAAAATAAAVCLSSLALGLLATMVVVRLCGGRV
jgi:hypothetical protein